MLKEQTFREFVDGLHERNYGFYRVVTGNHYLTLSGNVEALNQLYGDYIIEVGESHPEQGTVIRITNRKKPIHYIDGVGHYRLRVDDVDQALNNCVSYLSELLSIEHKNDVIVNERIQRIINKGA